jgi:hypothetical protein
MAVKRIKLRHDIDLHMAQYEKVENQMECSLSTQQYANFKFNAYVVIEKSVI